MKENKEEECYRQTKEEEEKEKKKAGTRRKNRTKLDWSETNGSNSKNGYYGHYMLRAFDRFQQYRKG